MCMKSLVGYINESVYSATSGIEYLAEELERALDPEEGDSFAFEFKNGVLTIVRDDYYDPDEMMPTFIRPRFFSVLSNHFQAKPVKEIKLLGPYIAILEEDLKLNPKVTFSGDNIRFECQGGKFTLSSGKFDMNRVEFIKGVKTSRCNITAKTIVVNDEKQLAKSKVNGKIEIV